MTAVGIIGGGCSGALVAAHLLREGDRDVVLIDASGRFARGTAYSTTDRVHIMNVRAASLSAYPDDPEHFVRWLRASKVAGDANTFVPRSVFGNYLCGVLGKASNGRLRLVTSRAKQIRDGHIVTADGDEIATDSVVLALGNLPQRTPCGLDAIRYTKRYVDDPWSSSLEGVASEDDVLVVGTGLTALDVILSLAIRGHVGQIHAISRHGLLPHAHRDTPPVPLSTDVDASSARALLASIRRAARSADDWRDVVDSLRGCTQHIWRSLPHGERERFLRHAARHWEVHRHRAAPSVIAGIEALVARGRVTIARGRIAHACFDGDAVDVHLTDRVLRVGVVINCTGPSPFVTSARDPLLDDLLTSGRATPGPHGMGLDTSDEGAVRDRNGIPSDNLFAIGPLRRGSLWESTAVPEIRTQAAELASILRQQRVLI